MPRNLTKTEGETAVFTCSAVGTPPVLDYQWRFNGSVLAGEVTSILVVSNVQRQNSGKYECLGRNVVGFGEPAEAYLLVIRKYYTARHPFHKLLSQNTQTSSIATKTQALQSHVMLSSIHGYFGGHVGREE